MPTAKTLQLIADMQAANRMTDAQLLDLRRAFGADMNIDAREADHLFALNALSVKPEGWADYFVLMITTYLVHQGQPEGHINDAMAAWLIARIDHDGVVETETELRLLMNILKVADMPGDRLEAYALTQVKLAVTQGEGRVGQNMLKPGVIGAAEVELLQRIFYSVGGDGGMGITRMEAEHIFELNEATKGKDNDPAWQRFFVGAIANHLMMIAAPAKLRLKEAQRREDWLKSDGGTIKRGLFNLGPRDIINAFKDVFGGTSNQVDGFTNLDAENISHAEQITDMEADWLISALTADGVIDPNERALLDFIREECPAIDASLRPLLSAA